jgi:hypothetical protein
MTIELPVFHLGLGGFSPDQQQVFAGALQSAAATPTQWMLGELTSADAWWMNGARSQLIGETRVRVSAGSPTGKSLQLYLPDIDRPVAFSQPIACPQFRPAFTFDPASHASMHAVLEKFDAWLSPLTAQFCLASHIIEHQTALGSGVFEVSLDGALIAVVDLKGEVGVAPHVGPTDFEQSFWRRRPDALPIPEAFVRSSLSQLMWQYAVRTQRDVLPRHYRTELLYFRRPPRLPQRMLKDSHLLLMRELARQPACFDDLLQRTALAPVALARDLAALYFVGAVTSNPKRAGVNQRMRAANQPDSVSGLHSSLPSGLDTVVPLPAPRKPRVLNDRTVPAQLSPR